MSQNRSSAVMQQRSEPHDSLEDFPTPPWATRALMEYVIMPAVGPDDRQSCWEPACNRGFMMRPLKEYFPVMRASDVHDYGLAADADGCPFTHDFLMPGPPPIQRPDWIITNPPFRLAQQFIERSRSLALCGVAMIVRSAFLEGVGRYAELFSVNPPSIIAQFTERVVMVKGRVDPKGSTATAYCWLVWLTEWHAFDDEARFMWIPPCRKSLERPGDYDLPVLTETRA